jgi:hypothetical protein
VSKSDETIVPIVNAIQEALAKRGVSVTVDGNTLRCTGANSVAVKYDAHRKSRENVVLGDYSPKTFRQLRDGTFNYKRIADVVAERITEAQEEDRRAKVDQEVYLETQAAIDALFREFPQLTGDTLAHAPEGRIEVRLPDMTKEQAQYILHAAVAAELWGRS